MTTPTHHRPPYRSLALFFFWTASSVLYGAFAQAASFAALDEALLVDLISAYDTHEPPPDECTSPSSADATTFSFDWPGPNDGSSWDPDFVGFEESLFQASMSHDAGAGSDASWTMRIGTGGNVYSHYVPDLNGEAVAPQARADSPWVDEVQQCVSVNEDLNNRRRVYDPGEAVPHFNHQAGAYQRDSPHTDDPFFSPSLARHCAGNSCYFASWGTQAHTPTPFTSPIMYVNKYTNCGGGIVERMMMIHNFAPVNGDASDANYDQLVGHTFFNVDWGGVRTSSLPYALEPQLDGNFSYADPGAVDNIFICPWGSDGPDGTDVVWRGERQDLRDLRGYTSFATPDLIVNDNSMVDENGYLDPYALPCRKSTDPTCATANSCMVSICTQDQIDNGTHTRMELKVAPHSTPNCRYHRSWVDDLFTLQCNFRDEDFGVDNALQIGVNCRPWANIGFKNINTNETLEVLYVRHWSFRSDNRRVYFAINETNSTNAIHLVNTMFDNTNGDTPLEIRVVLMPGNEPPSGYDASTVAAFTYVYGMGSDHTTNIGGRGSSSSLVRAWPPFSQAPLSPLSLPFSILQNTVFTIIWFSGIVLEAGSTYVNRSFKFAGRLGDVASTAGALVDRTFADEIGNELWRPRRIDIYRDSGNSTFAVVAADAAEGDSTRCGGAGTTLVCEGYSTPRADHRALFYMECGASTMLDFDPYHFAPDFGAKFPYHGTVSNPVRSYEKVCDVNGVANSTRPTWKLVGFFNASCAELDEIKTHSYDESICGNSAALVAGPWEISYLSLSNNFSVSGVGEISTDFMIGKNREPEVLLLAKDCRANITGISINTTKAVTNNNATHDRLSVHHSVDKSSIGSSTIWNDKSKEIEVCQVIRLVLPASESGAKMVIAEDVRQISIVFDLFAGFNVSARLAPGTIFNETSTTDVSSYVEAYKCRSPSDFNADDSALGPNQELFVCVVSIAPEVNVDQLVSMTVTQQGNADASLDIVQAGSPFISSITSIQYDDNANGVVVGTRLPANTFNYAADASVLIQGEIEMKLAGDGTSRKLRALVDAGIENGEKASYALRVDLQQGDTSGMPTVEISAITVVALDKAFAIATALAYVFAA